MMALQRQRTRALLACLVPLAVGLVGCDRDPALPEGLSWQAVCDVDSVGIGDALRLRVDGVWPAETGPLHLAWSAPAFLSETKMLISETPAKNASVWSSSIVSPDPWKSIRLNATTP